MESSLYEICRDQGSIIGGLLALVAGGIAYCGAWNAAKLQERAMNGQTAELKQQNKDLKNENRLSLARQELLAIRFIFSILNRVTECIEKVRKHTDDQTAALVGATLTEEWRNIVRKPPLSTVVNHLSVCGGEIVDKYLLLDARLDAFAERPHINSFDTKLELDKIAKMVEFLKENLNTDADRCYAVVGGFQAATEAVKAA